MKFYRIKISNQHDGKLIHNYPLPYHGNHLEKVIDIFFSTDVVGLSEAFNSFSAASRIVRLSY